MHDAVAPRHHAPRRLAAAAALSRCANCAAACAASTSSSPASRSASWPSPASARSRASLADGLAREGRTHPRRRRRLLADPARSHAARSAPSSTARQRFGRRHPARDGARGRWPSRRWSRSRRSTAPIRCSARSRSSRRALADAARRARRRIRRRRRSGAAGAARSEARRSRHCRHRDVRVRAALDTRARQARRRHRLRPALADQRDGACAPPA